MSGPGFVPGPLLLSWSGGRTRPDGVLHVPQGAACTPRKAGVDGPAVVRAVEVGVGGRASAAALGPAVQRGGEPGADHDVLLSVWERSRVCGLRLPVRQSPAVGRHTVPVALHDAARVTQRQQRGHQEVPVGPLLGAHRLVAG